MDETKPRARDAHENAAQAHLPLDPVSLLSCARDATAAPKRARVRHHRAGSLQRNRQVCDDLGGGGWARKVEVRGDDCRARGRRLAVLFGAGLRVSVSMG